jgi:putative addiction module killer protein
VYQLRQTEHFVKWLVNLRDIRVKARILARLDSTRLGSEMRIDVGAGYRVYFTRRQKIVVILLCGGDKSTQTKDIARAKLMAQDID